VAYGFAPVLFGNIDDYLNAAHADDEAIEIEDLVEMAAFHLRLITAGFSPTSHITDRGSGVISPKT
jgi:hypothetical protein